MWIKVSDGKIPNMATESEGLGVYEYESVVVLMTDGKNYFTGYYYDYSIEDKDIDRTGWKMCGRDGYDFDGIIAWKEIEEYK